MKLANSLLCLDCEEVYEGSLKVHNSHCPGCASGSYIALGAIMGKLSDDPKEQTCVHSDSHVL